MRRITNEEFDQHYKPRRPHGSTFDRRGGALWAELLAQAVDGPIAVEVGKDTPDVPPTNVRYRLSLEGRMSGRPVQTTIVGTEVMIRCLSR